jgi:hypothetical protein
MKHFPTRAIGQTDDAEYILLLQDRHFIFPMERGDVR